MCTNVPPMLLEVAPEALELCVQVTSLLGVFTVSLHNFKSQNFKLSVSNPKSKYVAYVSVLSKMSNCQGLCRKNKRDILKTDRNDSVVKIGVI